MRMPTFYVHVIRPLPDFRACQFGICPAFRMHVNLTSARPGRFDSFPTFLCACHFGLCQTFPVHVNSTAAPP
jgi:hypothetical protein